MLAVFFQLVGPQKAIELFGVRLLGFNAENGKKLLFSIVLIVLVRLIARLVMAAGMAASRGKHDRLEFWTRQIVRVVSAILIVLGVASIWFDDPTRMATALGLVTAGLAFALQKVVTAFAGYLLILRGKTFNVGDRITMGGVRGDVIEVGFLQTTIMEMGQPPGVQNADPAMWVKARQYSGRIVSVSNSKIFDEPVYNYTKEFPYIWEEMTLPIKFDSDYQTAERILLDVTRRHTIKTAELSEEIIGEMERRYMMRRADIKPRVFMRLTDNWIEFTVRFLCPDAGIRDIKDAISRDLLKGLNEAKIGIASTTFEIVGLPPLRIERNGADRAKAAV